MNLISGSTQGSNEDAESLQKNLSEGELTGIVSSNRNVANEAINLADPKEVSGNVQVEVASRHEVNDVFWEQFLTERPCYSDNEEAISN
ncbi:heat stress transcription factor-like protein, putative [Medicago truncatula]|uniref:Heat stress transcription factor-like protein, putative n=1 Tax=Medicago truncatula TaxID=3880 RepID=G7KJI3_MEDTR|nr:heat stress transcription factor-like protein, putative [Medicago truncatula]